MRPLGDRKVHTRVEGHQDCGVCHPPRKGRKAKEKRTASEIVDEALVEKAEREEIEKDDKLYREWMGIVD
jgi:hypothetical protein